MLNKLAVLILFFGLGINSSQALVIPIKDQHVTTFDQWDVYIKDDVYAAYVSDIPTGPFQVFQDKGDEGLFGQYCYPKTNGACVWTLAAKAKCEQGKTVSVNALFSSNGYTKSAAKKFSVACEEPSDDYFHYVFSDANAKEIFDLLRKVDGEQTIFLDFELPASPGKTKKLSFHVWGANDAISFLRKQAAAAELKQRRERMDEIRAALAKDKEKKKSK